MKTIAATATLTIMFLSAGAFAGNDHRMAPSATNLMNANVTVIEKNQAWPVNGRVPASTCSLSRCIDI